NMLVSRRISSSFRDIPGGQLLGRTRDYTQRLLDLERESSDPNLAAPATKPGAPQESIPDWDGQLPKVSDAMRAMGLMKEFVVAEMDGEPDDITRHSMRFPVSRPAWLQALSRSETGALVCLAYSGMRGYGGGAHGTIAELRVGDLPLIVAHPLTGKSLTVGHYRVTECEMTGSSKSKAGEAPKYDLSYGLVFGQNERKAISMSLIDSALMIGSSEEGNPSPINDQEMVLYSSDGVESFGFVEHLKLPHFVTFGSGLQLSIDNQDPSKAGANGRAEIAQPELVSAGNERVSGGAE
ncbi:MAG: carbon-phosphorus lyase complex subunit PhnI, partial [Thermomicrobiales bacterium]